MNAGERVRAIQAVAHALAAMSEVDRDLILRQFGLPTDSPGNFWDPYDYVLQQAERAGENDLVEVLAHLRPDLAGMPQFESSNGDGPWEGGSFRLFISHTSANKRRAGNLARILGRYGVDAFVAHDAIEPTREWQDEIEKALRSCDALCAILTPDFIESRWCDQEIGFVVARRKLVVPIKVDADPHGFIGKYQALTISPTLADASDVADKVLLTLVKSPLTAEGIASAVVRRYVRSGSVAATRTAFEMLQALPASAWTQDLIEQVDRAAEENNQVDHADLDDGTGRSIPALVNDMLSEVRPEPEPAATTDDIPF